MNNELIIYVLAGIILFQIVVQIIVVLFLRRKEDADHHEKNVSQASTKIIEHANKKAEQIIQNAVDKAEEIIYQSQTFNDKVQKELSFSFKDAMEKHKHELAATLDVIMKEYKETFTVTKQSFIERSNKTIDQIREYGDMEFAMIKDQSSAKAAQVEEYIRKKIDMEFDEAKKEIDKYKEVEKGRVSQMIREAIAELTNEVLRLSIPKSEQERLIMEALDKARKDNIFSI